MKTILLQLFVLISGIASSQISLSYADYQNAFRPTDVSLQRK